MYVSTQIIRALFHFPIAGAAAAFTVFQSCHFLCLFVCFSVWWRKNPGDKVAYTYICSFVLLFVFVCNALISCTRAHRRILYNTQIGFVRFQKLYMRIGLFQLTQSTGGILIKPKSRRCCISVIELIAYDHLSYLTMSR